MFRPVRHAIIKLYRNRHGNVAIITGLMLPVLVAFCGLGAETGYWYLRERTLQGAADVAAYNGAMALRSGASSTTISDDASTDAVKSGWNSAQGAITVNTPPASGPNQNNRSVEVLLTENERRYFTAMFFSGTVPITVRAVATYSLAGPACMLGLDKGAGNTVQFWGNAYADFKGCNIVSDSVAGNAFSVGGAANVTAPCVDAVGGDNVSATLNLTSCTSVTTTAPYVPDPYNAVPAPAAGSCQSGPINGVLSPGTYCGGLSLNGTVSVSPGVYVISGGTFKINSNADISGSGVTFYLTNGATLQFNGNATMDLSAPTSGTYSGLLFYGDRTQAYMTNTINGTASSEFTGALYFPSGGVDLLGNFSGSDGCMQVVADTIYYTGSATFTTNCTGTGMATMSVPGSVTLVE
ncbi:MAG: pilus assembly protein [Alphaproteobacteria bacterium]|nr:pilus assembly protein [Alphaproteobacteria bacterium]MDE2111333.1 pilus assembly protein [Alphaproteobacteria bacterium]